MNLLQFSSPTVFSDFTDVVILAIIIVAGFALLFFLLTLINRIIRISENKEKIEFQQKVEKILFEYLFGSQTVEEAIKSHNAEKDFSVVLFQKVALKAIVSLHQNYGGSHSKRLEIFYEESGLAKYSVERLNSKNWTDIVEGVRDLSTMNHLKSFPRIVSRITHPHHLVRTEVILGMIKMKGIEEIMKFKDSNIFLNNWVQSNILYTVKKYKVPAPQHLGELLQSKNKSMVLLGVRLINYYNAIEFYETLSSFYHQTEDLELKREISAVLRKNQKKHLL